MGIRKMWMVGVAMAWVVVPALVRAQVCGDADGSGAVTVTDGVQTLRAAAGLGSSCTASRCDVDASGAVTVSDGVNVLRKAAGLAIGEGCPTASTQESVRAFLGEMTKVARTTGAAASATLGRLGAAAGPAAIVECDDGFFETEGDRAVYHQCRFGTLVIDGAVTSTVDPRSDPENGLFIKTDVYERYSVRFVDVDFTFRQDGVSTVEIDTKANRLVENGTLTIFVSDSVLGQDEYTLTKIDLTTDTLTGTIVTGRLVSALAAAGLGGIEGVTLGYRTSTTADVAVDFDDGRSESFLYDLVTNELRPAGSSGAVAGGRYSPSSSHERTPT